MLHCASPIQKALNKDISKNISYLAFITFFQESEEARCIQELINPFKMLHLRYQNKKSEPIIYLRVQEVKNLSNKDILKKTIISLKWNHIPIRFFFWKQTTKSIFIVFIYKNCFKEKLFHFLLSYLQWNLWHSSYSDCLQNKNEKIKVKEHGGMPLL